MKYGFQTGSTENSRVSRLNSSMIFLDENPDLKKRLISVSYSSYTGRIMPRKSRLKKTAAELPPSQVEYLSVAYLENDLTPGQFDDLNQNIDQRQ